MGDRLGGRRARRHPPRPRHHRRLRDFVAKADAAGPRGRARPRPAVLARPPVGDRAPGVVHHAAPTARSPTPRTRRRSTRTSTRSTSTTTPRASAPRCCGSCGSGCRRGVRIFRVDNPHTKPLDVLGVAARARSPHRPGRAVPRRGVHPAGDDARARRGRDSSSRTPTSPGATRSRSSRSTCAGSPPRPADFMRPNLFVNTPDILTEYLQFGGPPAFKIRAALAATAGADAGASTPGTSCSRTSPRDRAARRTSTTRSTSTGRGTGRAPTPAGDSLAPYLTRAQRDPARAPGAAAAAQPARALERQRRDPRVLQDLDGDDCIPSGAASTRIIVVANVDPHSVPSRRSSTLDFDALARRSRAATFDVARSRDRRDTGRGAQHNYVRLDAFTEPVAHPRDPRPAATTPRDGRHRDLAGLRRPRPARRRPPPRPALACSARTRTPTASTVRGPAPLAADWRRVTAVRADGTRVRSTHVAPRYLGRARCRSPRPDYRLEARTTAAPTVPTTTRTASCRPSARSTCT